MSPMTKPREAQLRWTMAVALSTSVVALSGGACGPRAQNATPPEPAATSSAAREATAPTAQRTADVNSRVQSIVSMPDVSRPALERVLGVQLNAQPRPDSEFEFYAAQMTSGAFEHVEFSPPKAGSGSTESMIILDVRVDVPIAEAEFQAMFEASNARLQVGPPHKREPNHTYSVRTPSGYVTSYVFSGASKHLTKIVIRHT